MTAPPSVRTSPAERPQRQPGWWTPGRARFAGLVTGVTLVLGGAAAYLFWTQTDSRERAPSSEAVVQAAWGRPVVTRQGLALRSGVQITQVAVTGAGGLVDLRFKVIDSNLATTVHDPANPPAIVDERTGLVIHDLFMDHAHTGSFKTGVTYYYVFINSRNWIQRGSHVTVLLGNAAVEHVVVQ